MHNTGVILPADGPSIRQAAEVLRAGGLVAFPTETVYGLGGNALDERAVARIYAAKGRPSHNPLILHVTDALEVAAIATEWPDAARILAARFWPGPLTLVLPRAGVVPAAVAGGGSTIAVRCPAHPVARALIREAGVPIAAPSANASGGLSPTTAMHVAKSLGANVDLILDGGQCPGGLESTVVDVTARVPRLLRPGPIPQNELERLVGPVLFGPARGETRSPGLLPRHYSPRTPLVLADTLAEATLRRTEGEQEGQKCVVWEPRGDVANVSHRLYADLHHLDEAGWDVIIAVLPPATTEWAAVRDRLTRAAAKE
jgi:L-threonylcarbamoyladenylate synthase